MAVERGEDMDDGIGLDDVVVACSSLYLAVVEVEMLLPWAYWQSHTDRYWLPKSWWKY